MKTTNFFIKVAYLLSDDARKIPFFIVLVLLLSVIDLIGIGMIGPYLSIILQPENLKNDFQFLEFIFSRFESVDSVLVTP